MPKLQRNLDDEESRDFWGHLEACVKTAVSDWPDWIHNAFEMQVSASSNDQTPSSPTRFENDTVKA